VAYGSAAATTLFVVVAVRANMRAACSARSLNDAIVGKQFQQPQTAVQTDVQQYPSKAARP
jgi:hypothetical protein